MDLDRINEIRETAIRQAKYLPALRKQHETLDKEFEAALENVRRKRERHASYGLEADREMAKLQQCQRLDTQEIEKLENVQSEQDFNNQLIAKENEETNKITFKYEEDLKEVGELFRSAPLLYERSTLNKVVEDIRSCASQLNDELAELKREVEEVKQQFIQRKEPIRDDGIVTGIDALMEVHMDGVLCDDIITALKSKEKLYEQKIAAINQELHQANAIKATLLES